MSMEMNKANECTCPSGDGSLVHPCPAHPAVEQAGGDERAADEKPRATRCPDCGEHDLMPGDLCACGYETDPATGYACSECDGSGEGCVGEVCRECDGSGWFVTPDQARAALAQPSPAQAEQAEAERPEVVARVVHSNPVVLGQCGPLNANDELMTVAQHAASVARWAEMFNRVEQERDAALARVAEFEAQAQHSVPAAWYYDAPSQAEAAIIDIRGMWGEDDCPTYEDVASALRRLLAAAPGKEVGHE